MASNLKAVTDFIKNHKILSFLLTSVVAVSVIYFIKLALFVAQPGTEMEFWGMKVTKARERTYLVKVSKFSGKFVLNGGVLIDNNYKKFWINKELSKEQLPTIPDVSYAKDVIQACWISSNCANSSTEWLGQAIHRDRKWEIIDSRYHDAMEQWYKKANQILKSDAKDEIPAASIGAMLKSGENKIKFEVLALQPDWNIELNVSEQNIDGGETRVIGSITLKPDENKAGGEKIEFILPIEIR